MTAFIKTQATFIKSIHILVRAAMNLYGKAHPPHRRILQTVYTGSSECCKIDNVNMKLQISYKENRFLVPGWHVDSTFFSLCLISGCYKGDTKQPFPNMNSVVISASEAKKYFGNENALGKVLTTSGLGNFTVSGVMQDFPANSTLQFKILFLWL